MFKLKTNQRIHEECNSGLIIEPETVPHLK
jgi:hypothetical protein